MYCLKQFGHLQPSLHFFPAFPLGPCRLGPPAEFPIVPAPAPAATATISFNKLAGTIGSP